MGWSLYRAVVGVSRVTDSAYYVHGLHHGTALEGERAAAGLGWKLEAELDHALLRVRLSDGRGEPVSGARVRLAVLSREGVADAEGELSERAPGVYSGNLPPGLPRGVRGRVEAALGTARIIRPILLFP
jgi:nitrogen fixation protein FixH